ncbi:unnamed protein product [[Candida] boidinii]|uniref:Unnamed protein product n=1 Tax=Candida boidinii TaxID=5477 RepID=A0A9W6WEN7_CANBO|nr:unnamed protein product [[Candida] boidinii]GMF99150.1 unnamed protein product [[Candida] boidinii]
MSLADQLMYSSDEDEGEGLQHELDFDENEEENLEIEGIPHTGDNYITNRDSDYSFGFTNLLINKKLKDIDDIRKYSKTLAPLNNLLSELNKVQSKEKNGRSTNNQQLFSFLSEANSILDDVVIEANEIYSFIALHYSPIFPELSSLVPNPREYCQIIHIIKDDVRLIDENNELLHQTIQQDRILVLTMAASLLLKNPDYIDRLTKMRKENFPLETVLQAVDLLIELFNKRDIITQFISDKLSIISPNVAIIVGAEVAAQIISIYGLEGLCKTPSCNIPSLGVNRSSTSIFSKYRVRNQGYLYNCDLVQNTPEDYRVQAMRMISAKIALAARIDYGNLRKNASQTPSVELGLKWRQEIISKLEKLQVAPDSRDSKPLPIPIVKPSKKRGGRRFRKYKEKFGMSEFAKAQNKMVFGEQEETRMDSFGKETGLGLASKFSSLGNSAAGGVSTSSYRKLKTNDHIKSKVSKNMAARLELSLGANQESVKNGSVLASSLTQNKNINISNFKSSKSDNSKNINLDWLNGGKK